ncbi:SDR family oxidoreductase [Candidatus Pacearchaeota archaeon]|nr:SDR family oxidoreductase [Candidatus Pacearchaeota archaeon]
MKILVTGGAGFIGSQIVDALIEKRYEVVIVDNLSSGRKENLNKKAKFFQGDIVDFDAMKPLFTGVDYVFHTAAQARMQPSIFDPRRTFQDNVIGTLNVLLASKDAKVRKVVYSASSSAYGAQKKMPLQEGMKTGPKNPYALSKIIGEQICKLFSGLYGLKTISLRYFNVYGQRQPEEGIYATVIGIFLRQKYNREPLTIIGDGQQKRDFTYVSDIVKANLLAMESPAGNGEIINIGTGKNDSINSIAEMVLKTSIKYACRNGLASYIPKRPGEVEETLADISRASKLLGWKPSISMKEGLQKTASWYEQKTSRKN